MELLKGVISNLKTQRRRQDFVTSDAQRGYIEAAAAGAALMGMGAQAMGLVNISANSAEEADWVEFELDGNAMRGWMWKMPMSNGDYVEVVAESAGRGRYVVYSIRRPEDDIVAVFPHAMCGRPALYRRVMKMMLWFFCIIYGVALPAFLHGIDSDMLSTMLKVLGAGYFLSFLMLWTLFYISYRKLRGFADLAEQIFECYGWQNPGKIDLMKSSKKARPTEVLDMYGIHYYRHIVEGAPQ